MRKMLFFFGILSVVRRKGRVLTFFLLCVWCCNPTREKKQKNISKEEANHHHFKGRREYYYYHTFCAHTNIIMSFNFGNDGATQFQGGGYGCVNCLLSFLPPVRIRTRDDDESFWKHF